MGNPVANSKTNSEKNSDVTEPSTAVAIPKFSDADLRAITSFDDAMALVAETYGQENVFTADQVIGNGFRVLSSREKDRLIGAECMFINWRFNPGKYNDEFVTALVVTRAGEKYLLNDSGSGICKQLQQVTESTGREGGMYARHGLSRSDYEYEDAETGKMTPASTYYIDTSV